MITFIKYLKIAPYVIGAIAAAWFAHKFIVDQYQDQITQLESDVRQYQAQNTALQVAAETNEQTIRNLETRMLEQTSQLNSLLVSNRQLQSEKDEYLSIFRRHDLTRLSLARPGLIEPRINNSTREVFRELEQASRQIGELNE